MGKKIKIQDKEYDIDLLSESAKIHVSALKFADDRIKELSNHQALLQRAKNSYMDSLRKEMLSDKAGFLFEDN
jgi:hypothetical protein